MSRTMNRSLKKDQMTRQAGSSLIIDGLHRHEILCYTVEQAHLKILAVIVSLQNHGPQAPTF